jgi:diguanylate cyclase (GGDEF)-like protein
MPCQRPITATMRASHRYTLVVSALLALSVVAGLAANVVRAQRGARTQLLVALGDRATLAGSLTSAAVKTDGYAGTAKTYFAGPDRTMPGAIAEFQGKDPVPGVLILNRKGRVLGVYPRHRRRASRLLAEHPELRSALAGRAAWSGLYRAIDGTRLVQVAVPFRTAHGRRVLALAAPVSEIQRFAGAFLASAPGVNGSRGYLVDHRNHVLAASAGGAAAGATLAAALRRAAALGDGERTVVAARVPTTDWRVVFSVPSTTLYAPVEGSARHAAWELLGALAAAVLALLITVAAALRRSSLLAHERLHDPLTGLPSRAILLQRIDAAVERAHRGGRTAAVLFIDLDRFKQVNDELGHTIGDRLLGAVADRLTRAVRPNDLVGRFGGDEFLVLCEDLTALDDAVAIAERIRTTLADDFTFEEHHASVGCSIGIAATGPAAAGGQQLITDADAAMYEIKRTGGGIRVSAKTAPAAAWNPTPRPATHPA